MKYMRYIILVIIFVCIVIYFNKQSNIEQIKSNNYLNNSLVFEGVVTRLKASDNHAFGIIELKITKSNVKDFNKIFKNGIYPYRIKGNLAELYCTVSIERKLGDMVKVVSNESTIYYNAEKDTEQGSIYIITDIYNINFVKENTIFK